MSVLFILFACTSNKDGAIEGTVVPPAQGGRVTVSSRGMDVATAKTAITDGRFRITIAPGTYDLTAIDPSSSIPVTFSAVSVKADETTTLPPIEFAQLPSVASIGGTVRPAGPATQVTLLFQGKERASRRAGPDGGYEFTGLSEGEYTIVVSSPGYADERIGLSLTGNRREERSVQLLYRTSVDGIDWDSGKIRARGVGVPPPNAPNLTVRRELARRAALADGQRNLLRIIGQVNVDAHRMVKELYGQGKYAEHLDGFVKGSRVAAELEHDDGSIEVELELPLNGPSGLSSYLQY